MRWFWPVYCATAFLSTSAVYRWAPLVRPHLAWLRDGGDAPPESLAFGDENVVRPLRAAPADRSFSPAPAVWATAPQSRGDGAQSPMADARLVSVQAAASPPGSPSSPSSGACAVELVLRGDVTPTWGVAVRRAEYLMMDDLPTGFLEPGKSIECRSVRYTPHGAMVEFTVDNARGIPTTPYLTSLTNLCLFAGGYRRLSAQEQRDLDAFVSARRTGGSRQGALPKGVWVVARGDLAPAWGIVRQPATRYKPDGTLDGRLAAGTFFDFRRTTSSSRGPMVLCAPCAADDTPPGDCCLVSLKDVLLFSGSYTSLAENQRRDVRTYYELNGKIVERRNELLQKSAAMNPHFPAYQKAHQELVAHIDKSREAVYRRDHAAGGDKVKAQDRLFELRMEEQRLRMADEEARKRFVAWKKEHAADVPSPDDDADVEMWTKLKRTTAVSVRELAY